MASLVWEGYVLQTENQIVQTGTTQPTCASTSGGVRVAIIASGVDPNSAVLKSHLLYGYDFICNQPGGSETADVTQSTVGYASLPILNNSREEKNGYERSLK